MESLLLLNEKTAYFDITTLNISKLKGSDFYSLSLCLHSLLDKGVGSWRLLLSAGHAGGD